VQKAIPAIRGKIFFMVVVFWGSKGRKLFAAFIGRNILGIKTKNFVWRR